MTATSGSSQGRSVGHVGLFIDNVWCGEKNERLAIVNPATEEAVGSVAVALPQDLDAALASSARGFAQWRATDAFSRGEILTRAAALIRERAQATAEILTLEQGKPLKHALVEIM